MAQVFGPRANLLSRLSIVGAGVLVIALIGVGIFLTRSNFARAVGPAYAPVQPVPFSHQQHVQINRIDCQYCHTGVEQSGFAGIPSTETCMSCHSQIAAERESLQPVRDSWETGQPLAWNKVHNLPDFVYFNHSIHVNKGVGCATCHGDVSAMGAEGVYKVSSLTMEWCLNCHRNPEEYVRPREEIYSMTYEPPANQTELGLQLVEQYNIRVDQLSNCSICHR